MYHRRSKTKLPQRFIAPSAHTAEVAMNKPATALIGLDDTWHAHAGPIMGCTLIGAVATLQGGNKLVHLQHYRSPERAEGIATFALTMIVWAQESHIVSMIAGVLSPRNKSEEVPISGPWVKPLSVEDQERIESAAHGAHSAVELALDTYLLGATGWKRGDRYPGMDVVVPSVGDPAISINLK